MVAHTRSDEVAGEADRSRAVEACDGREAEGTIEEIVDDDRGAAAEDEPAVLLGTAAEIERLQAAAVALAGRSQRRAHLSGDTACRWMCCSPRRRISRVATATR